jgi:hypothetical protein
MVQGLLDFFTGGGQYADPNNIDPRYGVPMGDVRQAAWNSIGNMSALLLAAGQPMEPQQRAAYLAQLGQAGSSLNTDLYNSAQRRLMQAQYQSRMEEMQDDKRIREDLKDPVAFQQKYGFNPAGLGVSDVRQAIRTIRTRDPQQTLATQLEIMERQRNLATPKTFESGGTVYKWDEKGNPVAIAQSNKSPYGTSERGMALQILEAGNAQGPEAEALRNSPRYAAAWQIATKSTPTEVVRPDGTKVIEMQPGIDPASAGFLPPANLRERPTAPTGGDNVRSSPYVVTPGEAEKIRTQLTTIKDLENNIAALVEDVEKNGFQVGAMGEAGGRQSTLYNQFKLKAKEANNLGVLNGPDERIIMDLLNDPTRLSTIVRGYGGTGYFRGQSAALRALLTGTRRDLEGRLSGNVPQALRQTGAETSQAGGATPQASGSGDNTPVYTYDPRTRTYR